MHTAKGKTMARYIDAEKAVARFEACLWGKDYDGVLAKSCIDDTPTADVVELEGSKAYKCLSYTTTGMPTADVVKRKVGNITNADRIRSMTDEELAVWIVHKTEGNGFDGYEESVKAWLDWLKQEANDGEIH